MTPKKILVILLCLVVVAAVAVVWYGVYHKQQAQENEMLSTDGDGYAEEEIPHADPLMVGKWQSTTNPHWYKVYYDDYDEDEHLFWGKEWNEAEEVFEEDLNYHGNGWFRWEKKGKTLREYATMDARDVPIHRVYTVRVLTTDSLVYFEPDYKHVIFRFAHADQ